MPHVNMEYAIMVPILLVQVILIPYATGLVMDIWGARRRETALQDVASHFGSTIQQLYFTLNREEIAAGNITQAANTPPFIESFPYTVTASSKRIGNSTIIDLYFALTGTTITTTTQVTMGPNVLWNPSIYVSNSTNACIKIEKELDGILKFSFG
ncbi:MAG: hypothetical protein QXM22_01905 [Candidatus Bathyarchaeia archaeon]